MSFEIVARRVFTTTTRYVEVQLVRHPGFALGCGAGFGRTFAGFGFDLGRFGLRVKMHVDRPAR